MACFLFYQRNRVANVRHAHGPAETRPMGEHYLRCCFSMSHWLMCDSVIDVSAYFEWLQIFCSFISGFVCLLHPYELVRRVFRVFTVPFTPQQHPRVCLCLRQHAGYELKLFPALAHSSVINLMSCMGMDPAATHRIVRRHHSARLRFHADLLIRGKHRSGTGC